MAKQYGAAKSAQSDAPDAVVKKRRMPSVTVVVISLCVVMLLAAVGAMIYRGTVFDSVNAQYKENEKSISAMTDELKRVQEDIDKKSDKEALFKNTAVKAGDAVAKAEEAYLSAATSQDVPSAKEAVKTIGSCMDGGKAGKPWVLAAAADTNVTWSFLSTSSFAEDSIPVMWQAKNGGGLTMAYVTGTYDAKKEKFSDISVHLMGPGKVSASHEGVPGISAWVEGNLGGEF